ncbi:hypothetical protein [Bailinhaonella thermotolerans]|uniref:Uncharacterized protein n=1 Tax=Bailinhaonella thermotolerans TaxID=1070861 RepID=A0A3A4B5C5_9ACTN|nr:hypothetical protein [Bailinhaonella thermotolerans]RJL33537.1 hypothetical protein D5H75_12290 [Bailinhaonella thermotolerans]
MPLRALLTGVTVSATTTLEGVAPPGAATGAPDGPGTGVIALVVVALLLGTGILIPTALVIKGAKARRAREAAEFETARRLAEEDVDRLAEEIRALGDGRDTSDNPAVRQAWQSALDAYDTARSTLSGARRPLDLRATANAVQEARYALANLRTHLHHDT